MVDKNSFYQSVTTSVAAMAGAMGSVFLAKIIDKLPFLLSTLFVVIYTLFMVIVLYYFFKFARKNI